jgi:hypothetical protein
MNIYSFIYLFVFQNYDYKSGLGNDERFPFVEDDKESLQKIKNNMEKLSLLKKIRKNEKFIIDEFIVEKNKVKATCLSNGGLMED